MPAIYDHYRSVAEDDPAGIYRVVGVGERVTLLRVADADGKRRVTGRVLYVDRDRFDAAFEPAGNPDDGLAPRRLVRNALQGVYWSVRRHLPV